MERCHAVTACCLLLLAAAAPAASLLLLPLLHREALFQRAVDARALDLP